MSCKYVGNIYKIILRTKKWRTIAFRIKLHSDMNIQFQAYESDMVYLVKVYYRGSNLAYAVDVDNSLIKFPLLCEQYRFVWASDIFF